ncbi:MAG: serine/threonine-protein kinase [Planctomycetota bacterium]
MSGEATRSRSEEQLLKRSFLTRFQDSVLSVGPLTKDLEVPESQTGAPHAPVRPGELTEQPEELARRGYRVTGEIGRGGMGVIYKATQDALDRVVAIKVLTRFSSHQLAGIVARFQREAKVLAQLSHPHILPIFDFFADEGTAYLVMPLCPGGTLAERIRDASEWEDISTFVVPSRTGGSGSQTADKDAATEPLTPCEVMKIGLSIARALEHAHDRGILHRDVKPSNILFDSSMVAQLCDFGLAAWEDGDDATLTRSGDLFGTPAYMSPEQLTADGGELTGATDVWSLGCSLYEGIMRRRPFGAATREALYRRILMAEPDLRMRRQGADVPKGLEKLLKLMLEKHPRRRPTAREVADKLEVLISKHCPRGE